MIAPAGDGVLGPPIGRAGFGTVQVPMAFDLARLREAHTLDGRPDDVVEDSALMRWAGHEVAVVAGDPSNVHVVDPASLDLARRLAASAAGE